VVAAVCPTNNPDNKKEKKNPPLLRKRGTSVGRATAAGTAENLLY